MGTAVTVRQAIECVRKDATITLVGNISPSVDIPLQAVVTRQVRLQGSCASCGECPALLFFIEQGRINVDRLISATVPLAEGAHCFNQLYNKEKGLLKVILNP